MWQPGTILDEWLHVLDYKVDHSPHLRHDKVVHLFLREHSIVNQNFQSEHRGHCELITLEESSPNIVEHCRRDCVNQYDTPME